MKSVNSNVNIVEKRLDRLVKDLESEKDFSAKLLELLSSLEVSITPEDMEAKDIKVAELEDLLNNFKIENNSLKEEITNLSKKLMNTRDDSNNIEALKTVIEKLKTEISINEEEYLRDKGIIAENHFKEINDMRDSYISEIESLKLTMNNSNMEEIEQAHREEIKKIKDACALELAQAQSDALMGGDSSELNGRILKLTEECSNKDNQIKVLSDSNETLENQVDILSNEIKALKSKSDDERFNELLETYKALEKEFEALTAEQEIVDNIDDIPSDSIYNAISDINSDSDYESVVK